MKLPASNKLESWTRREATVISRTAKGTEIKYGPYTKTAPWTFNEMRLHFANTKPFAVVTKLEREIEVSHWGNIYVEERYFLVSNCTLAGLGGVPETSSNSALRWTANMVL